MKGTHASDGTVTLTWNSQGEVLYAPAAVPLSRIYLPCEGCGAVKVVAANVVAVWCDTCQLHNADPDGQHPNCHQCERARPGPREAELQAEHRDLEQAGEWAGR